MRKPETSFEDILFRVDSVEASWNNLGLVIRTVRDLDKKIGTELSSTIDDLVDRLSYHVNKALSVAVNRDYVQDAEEAILELLNEVGASPLIFAEILIPLDEEEYGEDAFKAEPFPFDADFVAHIEDGGSAIHDGEEIFLSLLTLKNGRTVLVNAPHEMLIQTVAKYRSITYE